MRGYALNTKEFIRSMTLLSCAVLYMLNIGNYSYIGFMLLFVGALFGVYIQRWECHIQLREGMLLIFLPYIIVLFFSEYDQKNVILAWLSLIYIDVMIASSEESQSMTAPEILEKIVWGGVMLCFLWQFLFGFRMDTGDLVIRNLFSDKNYTGLVVFMVFMYGEKRNLKLRWPILIVFTLFFSESRSLILMVVLFFAVRLVKPFIPAMKKGINWKLLFAGLLLVTAIILVFSYFWVNVVSVANLVAYREGLNDGSNRMRFSANIYAWEYLLKENNPIIYGYGDTLKEIMHIPNDERVLFNGVRLVQTHNTILNILVKMGWIPGLLFLCYFSKLLAPYFKKENLEYIIPFLINSLFISTWEKGLLVFWLLIVMMSPAPHNASKYKLSNHTIKIRFALYSPSVKGRLKNATIPAKR